MAGMWGRKAVLAGVVPVVAALLLSACQTQPDDELVRPQVTTTLSPQVPLLPRLVVGDGPIGPDRKVTVKGSTIRVGPRSVKLAPLRIDTYVVARGGVYFLNGEELWFTDLSRAQPTSFTKVSSLVVSPDGGRIAFVDHGHGPVDGDGTRLALAVVYDTSTGGVLVSTYAGMGDVYTDDLAARYAASPPRILRIDQDQLEIDGVDGPVKVALTE